LAALAALGLPAGAGAAESTQDFRIPASDGVTLQGTLRGTSPLKARPVVVEFSPYGRGTATFTPGPAYNRLLVQIRGTGDSDGRFDALGPRTQKDVVQVLRWACKQPWSNGRLGINGFSASAITIYNSLHQKLPCVKTAVLKSGTFELYRDLLNPGGINNLIPGAGVLALIGLPALVQGGDRLPCDPLSGVEVARGLTEAGLSDLLHPSQDGWWRQRGFRGDVNHLPILMIDGFFDVESRGAFQAFQQLRRDGAHLVVVGAHDGAPKGTDAGLGEIEAWFDRYLLGSRNHVENEPRVKLWMADGDREEMLGGKFVREDGRNWPLPGTRWARLNLDPAESGSADSLNDGTLTLGKPSGRATQSYPALPSIPLNSDPYNTAIIGGFGVNALTTALPVLSDMSIAERLGLSYTTAPLSRDVMSAGPLALDLTLSTNAPGIGIWAVVTDVSPDGTPHPVAAGRLSTSYPGIDRRRSLRRHGDIVQPYGRFDEQIPAAPGEARRYQVELWPIGNRFRRGHRIRLHVVGASAASAPALPATGGVRVGSGEGARLMFPVLPGSDLRRALR
jgi:predicted acyl esterase